MKNNGILKVDSANEQAWNSSILDPQSALQDSEKALAEAQARDLERYWAACGHPEVKCWLCCEPAIDMRGVVYKVRSNLVNGAPPARPTEARFLVKDLEISL